MSGIKKKGISLILLHSFFFLTAYHESGSVIGVQCLIVRVLFQRDSCHQCKRYGKIIIRDANCVCVLLTAEQIVDGALSEPFHCKQLLLVRAVRLNPTTSCKRLKCSVKQRGTAELVIILYRFITMSDTCH